VYGDADKWRVIMEANRGRVGTDGALEVGTELQIPRN
jgi:nucleoid-associated protein YgaU